MSNPSLFNDETIERIKSAQKEWEEKNAEKFKCERKKEFLSTDGIPIKRIYTPADLKERNIDYLTELSFPGEYPFTRGPEPTMYRGRIYRIGQYAGASSVEETNKLYTDLIAHGQEALHVAFDLPTKNGYDSDDSRAAADVGRAGIAIDSLEDMEILFDGIDLSQYPCTLVITSAVGITLFAMLLATAEKQGHSQAEIAGVMQNDVLTGYGADGIYCFPPEAGMRLAIDICTYCVKHLPNYDAFNICQYHWGELGANRIQQVAWPLSFAIAYIEDALKRGLDIDDIGPKIRFLTYASCRDFLMEVAKARAMRRLYARIMKERFGAKNPASCMLWAHHACGGIDMTKEPLEMNIVRGAIGTLVCALSGGRSVGGATYDEPLGIPSKKASITAIQTRYLIAHESGVMDTVDPLAGSYYVEYFTSEIEERAAALISKIDEMGGAVEAIRTGYFQHEAVKNAYEIEKRIESGELVKVGVNMFAEEKEERGDYYQPDVKVRERQSTKLKALRQRRDNKKVKLALDELKVCARKEATIENNLVFPVLRAVKAYATVGEIRSALEEVFGYYPSPTSI